MKKSQLIKYRRKVLDDEISPVLCRRNYVMEDFFLILHGDVTVCSGQEGLLTKLRAYDYLGADALTKKKYIPDFSAKVITYARLLKIKREDYLMAISSIENVRNIKQ